MTVSALLRPEILNLHSYQAAASSSDTIKLNANEAPLAIGTGSADGLNRYPARRPAELTRKLAAYYIVAADNVLVTRGSSEGIDLLIRAFCSAGRDEILLTPPVFEMVQVYAAIQGAHTINVPLLPESDFALDTDALLCACNERSKIIFLCSPNNPVGTVIPRKQILQILEARAEKSVVVIDEAYIEYSDTDSLAPLVSKYENLVVLRTLSKGLALAGARCGAVIASAGLISFLDGVLAPFAMSSPVICCAEQALSDSQLAGARDSIRKIVAERERLRVALSACKVVEEIWPSLANFLFVRFRNLQEVSDSLVDAGIAIRTYTNDSAFKDFARISIGSATDNNRLLNVIKGMS